MYQRVDLSILSSQIKTILLKQDCLGQASIFITHDAKCELNFFGGWVSFEKTSVLRSKKVFHVSISYPPLSEIWLEVLIQHFTVIPNNIQRKNEQTVNRSHCEKYGNFT